MNNIQRKLYEDLISISSESRKESPFYYVDQEAENGCFYRIFGYMLISSYSEWSLHENTFWSRGAMFLLDKDKNPIKLVCLPMKKFFNLNENPLSMVSERILNEEVVITEKLDGSLMSTYKDQNGNLKLKSKMSTKSEHCQKAMELLNSERYSDLRVILAYVTSSGKTVDLEWTSPDNRVVLGYEQDKLTILSSQDLETLEICDIFEDLAWWTVKKFSKDVLETVRKDIGIEGYIVEFNDRSRVKIKSDWYCTLHKTKESISTPKNLYECCINEQADDLLSMFAGDYITINKIKEMQAKASKDFFEIKNLCESWYNDNKHLERKDYAIKTQAKYKNREFGLCMNLYLQKQPDYTKALMDSFE